MTDTKYTVYVFKDISIFETFLDMVSMVVKFKSKKMEDGKYVLEGPSDTIESLVKNFGKGTLAVTNAIGERSSAVVKMKDIADININNAGWSDVVLLVSHLNKINQPEWVLMYLVGYDEKCDDICVKYDI